MLRSLLAASIAAAVAGIIPNAPAFAEQQIARPPAVLSPDIRDPWLVQLQPGKRKPVFTFPRANRAFLFGPPATANPMQLAPTARQQQAALSQQGARNRPIDPQYLPQLVYFDTKEKAGTIVIDTNNRFLYLVTGPGQALRYGVGVGRPGFEWAGTHRVTRKSEWPDWVPPPEMLQRRPDLPRHMAGGPDNPLGARALYLGATLYRIHGSNEPWTIGQAVSSGCIRMRNEDVTDLYERVPVGAKVIVI